MNLGRRVKGWMDLRVTRVAEETHDTATLYMVDAQEAARTFDYFAGQYLTFRFDDLGPKPIVRSYTMSSSPRQEEAVAVTVKKVDQGLVSHYLVDQVKEGSLLRARGPIGRFCMPLARPVKDLVMVAAGSGVTPFVSILREYCDRLGSPDAPESMTLLVAYRSRNDLIAWDVLKEVARPGVRVITTLTRETASGFLSGRPNAAMLDEVVGGTYAGKTFMTCGPVEMMDMVVATAKARGAPAEDIHTESFA